MKIPHPEEWGYRRTIYTIFGTIGLIFAFLYVAEAAYGEAPPKPDDKTGYKYETVFHSRILEQYNKHSSIWKEWRLYNTATCNSLRSPGFELEDSQIRKTCETSANSLFKAGILEKIHWKQIRYKPYYGIPVLPESSGIEYQY